MKAVLKSEKNIEKIIEELVERDELTYDSMGAYQGTYRCPMDILTKFRSRKHGHLTVCDKEEEYHGWYSASTGFCFIGVKSKKVLCSGGVTELSEIFPIFGIDKEEYFG